MPSRGRVIIVSNRLPITVAREDGRLAVRRSAGGLATGLRSLHEARGDGPGPQGASAGIGRDERAGGIWIGWPGDLSWTNPEERAEVDRQLERLRAVPVIIDAAESKVFYGRISNGVIWPVCHDRLDRLPLRVSGWETYERVNRRFADAIAACWEPGDLVWVHDFQLFRVPALLRERIPAARIGFFLHIPFPNPEIFFALPTRRLLVEGIMGADLVGFHTRRYHGHFRAALRRLFHVEMAADETVTWQKRRVLLGVFPMGIDAHAYAERAATREVSAQALALRSDHTRLLVGVDRLDYSKGIPRRLLALEALLESNPEWREKVRLVQIAVPSRGGVRAYQRFRQQLEGLVGRINGRFGTPAWTPIQYVHRSVDDEQLSALYRSADVMLVTPLRDGMNLVAKEFVASRVDEDGVLLLSEFAGAADELTEALIVNPYDVEGTAQTIHRALSMDRTERRRRMQALRAQVMQHDVARWADSFVAALEGAGAA